jgi:hypothetical protein
MSIPRHLTAKRAARDLAALNRHYRATRVILEKELSK